MAWAMPTSAPVGMTVIGKPAHIGRISSGRFALRAHVDAWKGRCIANYQPVSQPARPASQ